MTWQTLLFIFISKGLLTHRRWFFFQICSGHVKEWVHMHICIFSKWCNFFHDGPLPYLMRIIRRYNLFDYINKPNIKLLCYTMNSTSVKYFACDILMGTYVKFHGSDCCKQKNHHLWKQNMLKFPLNISVFQRLAKNFCLSACLLMTTICLIRLQS